MKSFTYLTTLALSIASSTLATDTSDSWVKKQKQHSPQHRDPEGHRKHFGAYFPSYGTKKYPLKDVDMSKFSDVYYFVLETTQTAELAFDTAGGATPTGAKQFVAAAKAGGARPILSIGGWTASRYFSSNVATAENRTAFATSIAKFYHKYEFEGVDIDWEYPVVQGIGCNIVSPNDTTNLILFLVVLRGMLPEATFSMAASITGIKDGPNGDTATDLTALSYVLDYVNVMTYDAYGSWSSTTGPVAPFSDACATPEGVGLSVKLAVQIFLNQKFKPSQIVVGIPTYGRSWTTVNSALEARTVGNVTTLLYQNHTDVVPKGAGETTIPPPDVCGVPQTFGGVWPVSQLVSNRYLSSDLTTGQNGYKRYFDTCSATPFLFNTKTKSFISYDDLESSANKAKYAKSMGLRGVFIFDTTGVVPAVVSAVSKAL